MNTRITAVVGFSRCGTSLMMRMLDVGGIPCVADNKASYEYDRINSLAMNSESEWFSEFQGKAVKILEPHVFVPPTQYGYDFIWMQRDAKQQAKSQIKFLKSVAGIPASNSDWRMMANGIRRDTPKVKERLKGYPNSRMLVVNFEDLLAKPYDVAWDVSIFLHRDMNREHMAHEVLPRSSDCYPGFLEMRFLNR